VDHRTHGRPAGTPTHRSHAGRSAGSTAGSTFEDDDRDYAVAICWTAIWYALPAAAYTLWAAAQSVTPNAGCVSATGGVCPSPRSEAFAALAHNWLGILGAVLLSIGTAAVVRAMTNAWRAITVGLAATIIGSGLATFAVSLIR
jgi:hypothetical protein